MTDAFSIERPTRGDLFEIVELRKEELSTAIEGLKASVRTSTDLGARVAARPWGWVAAAFVGGIWLGLRGRISSERKAT